MLHYNRIYLRYYATLKVRKSESLFYKFNTCLQKSETHKVRTCSFFIFSFYDYNVNQLC